MEQLEFATFAFVNDEAQAALFDAFHQSHERVLLLYDLKVTLFLLIDVLTKTVYLLPNQMHHLLRQDVPLYASPKACVRCSCPYKRVLGSVICPVY